MGNGTKYSGYLTYLLGYIKLLEILPNVGLLILVANINYQLMFIFNIYYPS